MLDDRLSLFWQVSWKVAALCLLICAAGVAVIEAFGWGQASAWALGCLLGGAFTLLRFKMLQTSVEKSVQMEEVRASRYAKVQYILRYLLSGAVLAAAALLPWINPFSTVLAMIALKPAIYLQGLLDQKRQPLEDFPIVGWEETEENDEEEDWDRWQTYSKKAGRRMRQEIMSGGVLKKQPAKPAKEVEPVQGTEPAQRQEEPAEGQISLFDE